MLKGSKNMQNWQISTTNANARDHERGKFGRCATGISTAFNFLVKVSISIRSNSPKTPSRELFTV